MIDKLLLTLAAFVAVLFTAPRPRTPERDAQADADAEQEERLMRAATRAREDGGKG